MDVTLIKTEIHIRKIQRHRRILYDIFFTPIKLLLQAENKYATSVQQNVTCSWKTVIDQAMQAQQMQSLTDQASKLANAPLLDPTKNPQALEAVEGAAQALQPQ